MKMKLPRQRATRWFTEITIYNKRIYCFFWTSPRYYSAWCTGWITKPSSLCTCYKL